MLTDDFISSSNNSDEWTDDSADDLIEMYINQNFPHS